MSLPASFEDKMMRLMGEEYSAFCGSCERERAAGLRVNRGKLDASGDCTLPFALRPVPWAEGGYYYEASARPGKHPLHEAGVYYIQEPSAMAPAAVLDPKPGERVLDLCAAPGGKTTHAASLMGGEGLLLSNEIHPARAKILSQNVERMGIKNCVVMNESPERLAERFSGFFDKIIVDAPCSGEGMFRKDAEAIGQWSPEHVLMCAERQDQVLDCAAAMLRPGGLMVYSTCTFSPEENEGSVERFLERHPEFEIEKTPARPGFAPGRPEWTQGGRPELAYTFRLWPHLLEGEGHFLALLRRGGTDGLPGRPPKAPAYIKDRNVLRDFFTFCSQSLREETAGRFCRSREFVLFGSQLYLVPREMPDFSGLKVVRAGLHLGELKKNRFEPSHALALCLTAEEARYSCETGDTKTAERYLSGHALSRADFLDSGSFPRDLKGWALLLYEGFPLGWVKGAGETLKNHYPKGLRRMNVC